MQDPKQHSLDDDDAELVPNAKPNRKPSPLMGLSQQLSGDSRISGESELSGDSR